MRIVEVSTNLIPSPPLKGGAIERFVFNISKSLVALGLEVHLISVNKKRGINKIDGIIRHTYPREISIFDEIIDKSMYKFNPHAKKLNTKTTLHIYNIMSFIKETYGSIDVIHNHSLTTAVSPILFQKTRSKNTLLIMHHHNVSQPNMINKVILKQYDLHLAVSKYVKNEIMKRFKILAEKVLIVYNAINVNEYRCSDTKQSKLRDLFGIDGDGVVLLYVGRITPEKGLHHLIEAFKIVRRKLSSTRVKLFIVGPVGQFHSANFRDLAYFQYIQKLLRMYGLYNDVKYIGYVNNTADVYTIADFVVVPSIWQDPCPSTILEALASCKPVVAYPVGGIPEILEPLNYGFLAKSVSPIELAEAIAKIISNYDNVNLGYLREYVEKRFSIESVAKRLKTILEMYVKNK
ncbi:MAG: glycosyltransferase family 4 protein [Candidatus Geothermarchaeota archaeon]